MLTAMSELISWTIERKSSGHELISSDLTLLLVGLIDLTSSRHEVLSLLDMGIDDAGTQQSGLE